MTAEKYKTRDGRTQYRPVIGYDEYSQCDLAGLCLACGEESSPVDPDARKVICGACGAPKVYGLEELMVMGLVKLTGEGDE